MSGFEDQLEAELLRAARRPVRLGAARLRLPAPGDVAVGAGLTALVAAALVFVLAVRPGEEPGTGGTRTTTGASVAARPAESLGVLRRKQGLRDQLWTHRAGASLRGVLAIRTDQVRLARRDPDGRVYAVLPVAAFPAGGYDGAVADLAMVRNGLCLAMRGGGDDAVPAVRCIGPGGVAQGRAQLVADDKVIGLVPDGVAAVRPLPGGPPVLVKNNLYVYQVPVGTTGSSATTPEWLDGTGRTVAPADGPPAASGPVLLPAPGADLQLPYATGTGSISIGQLPPAPTVVTFTADWCDPCRRDVAHLRRLRLRGVTNLVVAFKPGEGGLARLQRAAGGAGLVVRDPGGRFAAGFGVRALPTTFFLDSRHRIASVRRGALTKAATDELLSAAGLGRGGVRRPR